MRHSGRDARGQEAQEEALTWTRPAPARKRCCRRQSRRLGTRSHPSPARTSAGRRSTLAARACFGNKAVAPDDTPPVTPSRDARQRRAPELRLLLSPGLSERLARRSTDEWSSSKGGTSSSTIEAPALGRKENFRLAVFVEHGAAHCGVI